MDDPLPVLRGGAPTLSPAPPTTRGPAGASRSPDGASRYERQSGRSKRKKPSEGLRRTPPTCTWSPSRRGVIAQVTPARPAARSSAAGSWSSCRLLVVLIFKFHLSATRELLCRPNGWGRPNRAPTRVAEGGKLQDRFLWPRTCQRR